MDALGLHYSRYHDEAGREFNVVTGTVSQDTRCCVCNKTVDRFDTLWFVDNERPAHWMCGWSHQGYPLPVTSWLDETAVDYDEYLTTAAWRAVRDAAIIAAGGRCAVCNAEGPLQGHHRTYERLGHEIPGDVIALCRRCHARHHGVEP